MDIHIASTDDEIRACFPVMVQLRPQFAEDAFLAQVRRQQQEGYQLAYLADGGQVRAAAGFRLQEMLYRGRHVYVDDLVTDGRARSQGYGDALFDWLAAWAREHECVRLELDSGVQRFDAHRFYFRKRMHVASYHFSLVLK